MNDSECCKINEENGEVDGRDWDEKGHEAGEDLTAVMVKEGQCQSGRLNSHAKGKANDLDSLGVLLQIGTCRRRN